MGNDGGTIAKRLDLLASHTKSTKIDAIVDGQHEVCALSSLPLEGERIVSDWDGHLYLKEKILEHILELRALLKTESITLATAVAKISAKNAIKDLKAPKSLNETVEIKPTFENHHMVCPVSQRTDLCYLRTCGCALSFRLLQDLKKGECPNCNQKYDLNIDVVKIQPGCAWNKELIERLKGLGMYHSKKKIKPKGKKRSSSEQKEYEEVKSKDKRKKKGKTDEAGKIEDT